MYNKDDRDDIEDSEDNNEFLNNFKDYFHFMFNIPDASKLPKQD
ncbi:6357_t:CDS:2 [Funneliformis mosseae]|uniref:6357_t:CDS:1 n=1 Tax=Funneliformis mosseae TaxID=27381 RepID=A0A9N8ZEK2_FUNMO|nr:6357_t:CDS:2 [Funneliformis mosseae]